MSENENNIIAKESDQKSKFIEALGNISNNVNKIGENIVKSTNIGGYDVAKDDDIITKVVPKSLKDSLKKMDITTFSIYAYLFLICGIYILFGFILTNCVFNNAKKTYNIIANIQIFATPTPTPKKTTPPAEKCIPAVTNKPKVPFQNSKSNNKNEKNVEAKNVAGKNVEIQKIKDEMKKQKEAELAELRKQMKMEMDKKKKKK